MDTILNIQNPHWSGKPYDGFIQRAVLPELLDLISLDEIQVLKGVRRCGKTTIFFNIISHLLTTTNPKSIVYANLDDPFFTPLNKDAKNLYHIIETAEKITGTRCEYLFLDEVQNMHQWEKFVKSVYDSKKFKKIFITGSNSALLEGKYATLLSGRYIEQTVFPLSFRECLRNDGVADKIALLNEKPKAFALFEKLLNYGGFPRCHLENDPHKKRKILTGYYNTILLKDCMSANNIRDQKLMAQLAHYMISNTSARYSYHNIAKAVDSNEKTVQDYIHALEQGLLLDEVRNFSYSLKKQARANKKGYCVDNGLINAIAFQFDIKHGKLFENLVYNELQKCGATEIFTLFDNKECDFIVKHNTRCLAIQVCHSLTTQSRNREIEGIKMALDSTRAERGIIVTFDQDEHIAQNIDAIPFWKLFALTKDVDALFSY